VAGDVLCGGVDAERGFRSVRMGVKDVSAGWLKASRRLRWTRFTDRGKSACN
jgi:hypothetical protein